MSEYEQLHRFTVVLSVIVTFTLSAKHHDEFNQVRIVNVPYTAVNDSLLNRIRNNGYNYAMIPFVFRVSNSIVGDGDVYENLREDVCSLCVALDRKEIRLIPLIPMSSRWALQWKVLQQHENPAIGMNTITANEDLPSILGENPICRFVDSLGNLTHGSNSWAPEPEGVDKSIIDIFTAIREGFADAGVDYPLEYVHIQHDEPQFLNQLLMAGVREGCGNVLPYRGNFARGEVSEADQTFIASKLTDGHTLAESYQLLLADELYRRVTQAEEVFGPDVKLLFYAESFDDQSWGGVPWDVAFGDGATITMHDVIALPGLERERKEKVKKQLIPMLWNYDGLNPFVSNILDWLDRDDYDTETAFDRFTSNGYRFLYVGALQNGESSGKQIVEYATAAENFRENCLGYCAAAWVDTYDPVAPDEKWDVIEFIPSVQRSTHLKNEISPSILPGIDYSSVGNTVTLYIAKRTTVSIDIFTLSGRHVENLFSRMVIPGTHTVHLKKNTGLYVVSIRIGSECYFKKNSVIK